MRFSILLPVVAYLLWFQTAADGLMDKATIVTAEGKHVFTVELAVTSKARQQGLMHRREMPRNVGMLFIFPSLGLQSFWMKDTLIPLDILFLEANGRVVHVHHDAQPRSLMPIAPKVTAFAVLEINGGLSRELGIKPGDFVHHPSLRAR